MGAPPFARHVVGHGRGRRDADLVRRRAGAHRPAPARGPLHRARRRAQAAPARPLGAGGPRRQARVDPGALRRAAQADDRELAALGQAHRQRGRRRAPQRPGAARADQRAHRRDGGGGNDVAAGERARPHVGLPLLLDPRLHVRHAGAGRGRVRRGGRRVPALHPALERRHGRGPADRLRRPRRAPDRRAGAPRARGLARDRAGAGRQQRDRPVPARRLRRAREPGYVARWRAAT